MRNMKKIIKILIIVSILFLFIGAVSASENTTTISKEKCKVKTKNVVGKTGHHKKIISYVRDSHNKPVRNVKLEITHYFESGMYRFSAKTDNQGRYIDNTNNYDLGKTKVTIESADSHYQLKGKYFVTIKPHKYVTKSCTMKWRYSDIEKRVDPWCSISTGYDCLKGYFFARIDGNYYRFKAMVVRCALEYKLGKVVYFDVVLKHVPKNILYLPNGEIQPQSVKVWYLKPI